MFFLNWLNRLFRPAARPPAPALFWKSEAISEEGFMLSYSVHVARLPGNSDVVSRHLKTTVNGTESGCVHLPRETVKIGGLRFRVGDVVRLELRDVDAAGNHSEPAVIDFVCHDTIAPAAPLGFGLELDGEVPDGDHLESVEGHDKVSGKPGEGVPAKAVTQPKAPEPVVVPPLKDEVRAEEHEGPRKFHAEEEKE